jgi:hypothetical protein
MEPGARPLLKEAGEEGTSSQKLNIIYRHNHTLYDNRKCKYR